MTDWLDDLFRARGSRMIAIADASTPTVVSDADAKANVLIATGPVTASRKMQIAHKTGATWIIDNQTGRDLLVGGPSGAVATVTGATRAMVYSDGTAFRALGASGAGSSAGVVDIGYAPAAGPVTIDTATAALPAIIVAGDWDGDGCELVIPDTVARADGAVTFLVNATTEAPQLRHGATNKGTLPRRGYVLLYWSLGTFTVHALVEPLDVADTAYNAARLGGTLAATVLAAAALGASAVQPSGTSSQVTLGDGTKGNVPAAALPVPAASTKGGVALPASATGLFYRDDGAWASPPPATISTTTTAGFTQPANFATVVVSVASVTGFRAGQLVTCDYGAYAVCSVGASSLVLLNLSYSWGQAPGATVASGSTVTVYSPSGIAASIVSNNFTGVVPLELYSLVSHFTLNGATGAETANNETHGCSFTAMGDGLRCTGVRYANATSRSVKVSIWDAGGTRLATATATTAGLARQLFGSPVTLTKGATYWVGAWITDQSSNRGIAQSTTSPTLPIFTPHPLFQFVGTRLWATGDAKPTGTASSEYYLVEPLFG